MSQQSAASSTAASFSAWTITIQEPLPFSASTITNVRCSGGPGTVGTICAYGTSTFALAAIWAKVYKVTDNPPSTYPTDGTATQGSVQSGSMSWHFLDGQEVPVIAAACPGPTPTANNGLLAVWGVSTGSPSQQVPAQTFFGGVCAATSNCSDRARLLLAQAGTTAATLETAPRQVQVQGKDFRGPGVSSFNALWVLSLRGGCGCACVWDNGGDGVQTPRVELGCDGVHATEWCLTLAHNGCRVRYTCPAWKWKALAANRLALASRDADGLPRTLTVTPV